MPSASRRYVAAASAAGLALVICGCTTTQTTAARLQLNDSRLRAAAQAVRVGAGDTSATVTVTAHTVLDQGGALEAAVTLDNHSDQAVSDLPISVGYQVGSHTVYLNGGEGLDYFDNHIPSIPAHGSLTWVDTATRVKIPRRARTFARVGATSSIPDLGSFTPPTISVTPATSGARAGGLDLLTVHLTNRSSIPQYQLPVYAVVTRNGRILAARDRSITELAGGAQAVVRIVLPSLDTGATQTSIRVQAPATIFK